ncbi:ParA family protein [Microbacterium sp. NPDC055665]
MDGHPSILMLVARTGRNASKMHVIAVGNRKGGVGKTTVTLNLGWAYVLMGKKVLIIDLDSQMNATTTLEAAGEFNIFDVLYSGQVGTLGDAIVSTAWPGLDAVPGSRDVARIESESLMAAEMRLKTAAHGVEALDAYDVILIDLPPSLGRLTLNGLVFADAAIAVTEPQSFSVSGLSDFLDVIQKVRSMPTLNPALRFGGIVVNRVSSSPITLEHKFQLAEIEAAYGEAVLQPYIPVATSMQDSSSSHVPLTRLGRRGARLHETFVELARTQKEAL